MVAQRVRGRVIANRNLNEGVQDEIQRGAKKPIACDKHRSSDSRAKTVPESGSRNRLVADTLETEWNSKLRLLAEAEQEYQRQRQSDHLVLNDAQTGQIVALATNFGQVWQNPALPHRERKRMVHLLIEDVTVVKRDRITLHVRFRVAPHRA